MKGKRGDKPKLPWRVPLSTDERRFNGRRRGALLLVSLLVAGPVLTVVVGTAGAITIPGITGFITNDGLFFIQIGYEGPFGFATYITNGSQVYAAGLIVNVTAITQSTQVAHIIVYSYATGAVIDSLNVPVPGYTSDAITISLPSANAWLNYRVMVDATPWYFSAFTPYSFLGFTGLQDGGVDVATFIAIGLFLVYTLPLMVKAERMTRRAIFAPRWNATTWLHGIFFGLVATYIVSFPWWNSTFYGWEFVVIPIPEALFLFFWTAGRHSSNRRALFAQIVPRMGQRLG